MNPNISALTDQEMISILKDPLSDIRAVNAVRERIGWMNQHGMNEELRRLYFNL